MKKMITCMQRVEKKYLLNKQQYHSVLSILMNYMEPDEYFKSTICNLYCDSDNYELIRSSIEKPIYKEKLRIRSYGIVSMEDKVFLEIKKKCDGVVNKRRICLTLQEVENYFNGDKLNDSSQIKNEISYLIQLYKVEPKVFIAYDRNAYKGKDDPDLRITFDFNIRSRFNDLHLSSNDKGTLLLDEEMCLMEIKVNKAYPLWLANLLSKEHIYPTSFSKYGRIFSEKIKTQGGNLKCLQVL